MQKLIWTASAIQKALQKEINELPLVIEDSASVRIPLPYWHEPDGDGANWNIGTVANATGYTDVISVIIERLRRKVHLEPKK